MSLFKFIIGLVFGLAMAACGGGGGSGGTPLQGSTSAASSPTTAASSPASTVIASTPTMALTFVDAAGADIGTHVLSQTLQQFLKVVLKDESGVVVPYSRVQIKLDTTEAVLVPVSGTLLTDKDGVVLMRVSPTSVSSSGTVQATASAIVGATSLTKTYDMQINAGTVALSAVFVSAASVQNGQSVNVSVDVTVNAEKAQSNSVAVTFNTTCGIVSPTSALVDSTGRASAVIQTTDTGDKCSVDASANGITTSPTLYTVTSPPITGIQFVSASPNMLYQFGSVGVTTSIVSFKVINSVAEGVQGLEVEASLTNTDGGINFCGSPSTAASSSDGIVTFSVCSGTLPASVQVKAKLKSNPNIFTNSNLLTVQTGLPTQRFFDISANQFNFYAGGYFTSKFNGNSVTISVFAADRQGNPVPDGTKIIFVSEGGQINSAGQSSCLIVNGRCSVTLIGQDYRPMGADTTDGCAPGNIDTAVTPPTCKLGGDPRPGRVTVLAYTDGEESFIDANNNNRYDTGELFEDFGSLYLDKDENELFNDQYNNLITKTNEGDFVYPMPSVSIGTDSCPDNSNVGLSKQSSCNKAWDGLTKVRRSIVIVFSGGEICQPDDYDPSIPPNKQTAVLLTPTASSISVRLADCDGNPLPADASLSVEVIKTDSTDKCSATLLGSQIGSTTEPTEHTATLKDCGSSGETVRFKVDVTSGSSTKSSTFGIGVPTPP